MRLKTVFVKLEFWEFNQPGIERHALKLVFKEYLYIYDKVVLIKNNQFHMTTVAMLKLCFLSSSCSFIRVDLISLLSFHL